MFVVKTWKERIGLMNSEPFRAFIGVEWEMQAEIDELRAALAQQAEHFAASEDASHPFNDVWHEVHEECVDLR